jgi:uncharacterized protein (TIGR03435 family)
MLACEKVLLGQVQGGPSSFDVALIKPAAPSPPGNAPFMVRGGPGSSDPSLAMFASIDLSSLVAMAFDVERHQLSGPEWLSAARFDITARVPLGATQDQYRRMLQDLLIERFKLVFHRDKKELQMYELVVAKNGPKLDEAPIDPATRNDGLKPPHPIPVLPPGFRGPVNVTLDKVTMEPLANDLGGLLGEPVADATGLTGTYTVNLHVFLGPSPPLGAEDIFEALEAQLGLRLVQKKRLIDIVVIDHIERTPTEN